MWEIFSNLRVPGFFCQFQVWCCWNEKDEKRTRTIRLKVWPSMRETRRDVCHSSNATINDLRWLRSHVFQLNSCCPGESNSSFPACRWTHSPISLQPMKVYLFCDLSQENLLSAHRPTAQDTKQVSSAWRLPRPQTQLMFPSMFLCVFACMRFGLAGFWFVLVQKWWLLIKGSFRAQRLKAWMCFRSLRHHTSPRSCFYFLTEEVAPCDRGGQTDVAQVQTQSSRRTCCLVLKEHRDVLKFSRLFFPCQALIRGKASILFL